MKTFFKYLPLIAASLFGTAPGQAATVSLQTSSSYIQAGDFFDVDVVVLDLFAHDVSDEFLAFGFNIGNSNNSLLRLAENPLFADKPVRVNPLFTDDSPAVELDAAGSVFPGIGYDAAGSRAFTLATLHFQALAAGRVDLVIGSDLSDGNQGLFFLNQGQLPINASLALEITAVPLPPAALLFVSGVAMGLGRRCNRAVVFRR